MPVVDVRLFIQGLWSDSEEIQKVLKNVFKFEIVLYWMNV